MSKAQMAVFVTLAMSLAWTNRSFAADGRIMQWLLAGPFETNAPNNLLEQDFLGAPAALAPSPGAAAATKKWASCDTHTGFINVNDKDLPVGTTRPAAIGAFVYVFSPKVQPAKLTLTFSDGLAVCLNGRQVFNQPDRGGNAVDANQADILLGEGWNRLYFKCVWFARSRATWSFGARLTGPDMGELAGAKLAVENPFPGGKIEEPRYSPFLYAFAVEHFGIHRVRLVNLSPMDLADAALVVRDRNGQKLQESKLGAIKGLGDIEVDIATDEVSFQQNWSGAAAELTFAGGKFQAPLAALQAETVQAAEYRTPCINRMKPWAAGRVKILVLAPGQNRQVIELTQRGDFECHVVDTAGGNQEMGKQLREELANSQFDCVVVAAQSWKNLPAEPIQGAFAKGAGLVVVTPSDLPESMAALLGLAAGEQAAPPQGRAGKIQKTPWQGGSAMAGPAKAESEGAEAARLSHPILAGEWMDGLPPLSPAPLRASDDAAVLAKVDATPVIIAQDKHPGRAVTLNFGRGSSLIWPIPRDLFLDNYRLPVWERQWSLVLKAVIWAAGKEGGTRVFCETAAKWSRNDPKPAGVGVDVFGAGDKTSVRAGPTRSHGPMPGSVPSDKTSVRAEPTVRSLGYSERSLGGVAFSKVPAGLAGGRPVPTDLPAGENEINVVLRDKDGKILWWADTVLPIEARGAIGQIEVEPAEKDYFLPADEIAFVVPGKADADGMELVARLADNHNRRVAEKKVAVKKGAFSEKFVFKPEGLLTTVGRFQAELTSGGVTEARGEAVFYVRHEFVWDKYEPVLWLTRGGADWYYDLDYFRMLNDVMWIPNGWSGSFGTNGAHKAQMVNAGLEGLGMESLHFFSMNHNWNEATFEMRRNKFNQTRDVRWLYRTPIDKATGAPVDRPDYSKVSYNNDPYNSYFPLDDPLYQEFTRKKITNQLKGVRRYNPLIYDLMDEGAYTTYARSLDFDFSPVSIERFRAWLKAQYGGLDALNKEWDTRFANWDEVMPMHIYQIREHVKGKARPSYAAWVDHRRYNDIVYNDYIALCSAAARAEDPDAYVGVGGGQRPNPYGGWDYWLVSRHFTWIENYFDDTTEYIRSFNGKDRPLKACPGADVWWSVKLGNAGFYRWVDTGHVRGDFSLLPRGQETARQLEEVRGRGFSKLLYKAEAVDDPIGIHYSQAAIQISYALGGPGSADQYGNGGPLTAKLGFYNLIEEMGYQYKFVSYAQVEEGHLQTAGYKLMVLPESTALSDKEAAQLKDFVEKGGVLFADHGVGQWTGHGRKREKTVLEEYFGMNPGQAADKQVGKGWVIYAACDWPIQYWTARQGKDVKPFWDKFQDALTKAGVNPARATMSAPDGAPARRTEIRYFDLGMIRYHVVSADVPGKYVFASRSGSIKSGSPDAGHAYDMREGRYGGADGKIEVAITQAFPALVAVSPYKIEGVTAKADKAQVQAGQDVTIAAEVRAEHPDVHALHFRVYGPDGVERRWYADTVFGAGGKAALTFKTALNEARGRWTVKVADLASGAGGAATFEVK